MLSISDANRSDIYAYFSHSRFQLTSMVRGTRSLPQEWNPRKHHVFLTTQPEWHEPIWIILAGQLEEMGVGVTLFTECDRTTSGTCIRFGLLDVARKAGVWSGGTCRLDQLSTCMKLPSIDLHSAEKEIRGIRCNEPLPTGEFMDTIFLATESIESVRSRT